MQEKILILKSKAFAIRVVNLYRYLSEKKKEFVLSKQLLRSGTSVGANLSESYCASSKKDFLAKVQIAFKECQESLYWLELLFETKYITKKEFDSIYSDCKELVKLLSATVKTTKTNIK